MLCMCCQAPLSRARFSRYSASTTSKAAYQNNFEIHHANHKSFIEAIQASCPFCLRLLELYKKKRKVFHDHELVHSDVDTSTFAIKPRIAFETPERTVISFASVIHVRKKGKELRDKANQFLYLAECL